MIGKTVFKRPWILFSACLSICVIVAGLYTVRLMFTEDLYIKKGTYVYYITIHSPTVKDFPQISRIGEEEYYYSCGDGPKQMANGINYLSEEQPKVLFELLDQFLKNRGFTKNDQRSDDHSYFYKGAGSSFELVIKPDKAGLSQVIGTEYYLS